MPNITSLNPKASEILDTFFTKIQGITLSDFSQRQQLLKRTKQLFTDLDRLGAEEFSEIFKYNYFHSSIEEVKKKYDEALNYLVTCVIERYSESDLLRYFLPQDLSQKENRPEYSDHTSRLGHWFQLIGYWFRQLLNKPIYKLNPENRPLADSVEYIKTSLSKKSYVENDSAEVNFRDHLSKVVIQLQKRLINSRLEDLANQGIIERERRMAIKEEKISEKERKASKKLEKLIKSEADLRQRKALFTEDRKEIEKKNIDLKKKNDNLEEAISNLKKAKRDEKAHLHHLQEQYFKNEEALEELKEKMRVLSSTSQNIEATDHGSLSNLFSAVIETSGQSNQDIRANVGPNLSRSQSCFAFGQLDQDVQVNAKKPKFYRTQSYLTFFSPEQQPKDNQFNNLQTTKLLDC